MLVNVMDDAMRLLWSDRGVERLEVRDFAFLGGSERVLLRLGPVKRLPRPDFQF